MEPYPKIIAKGAKGGVNEAVFVKPTEKLFCKIDNEIHDYNLQANKGFKKMKKTGSLLFIFILLFLYQCGSNAPEMRFYLIDYPVDMSNQSATPKHDVVIGVNRFKVHPLYDETRLVYRDSPYEGKYYNYHSWITPPADMVTDKVVEHLGASGMFKNVIELPKFAAVNYTVNGTILALEEWDEGNQWYARVKIAVDIFDMKNEHIVWQKILERKLLVSPQTPFDVVKGINMGVEQCIDELQQGLDVVFSK